MDVFLPIAQVFVNPIEILLLSAIVGVLSGLFGVGGGFLMTPFLNLEVMASGVQEIFSTISMKKQRNGNFTQPKERYWLLDCMITKEF